MARVKEKVASFAQKGRAASRKMACSVRIATSTQLDPANLTHQFCNPLALPPERFGASSMHHHAHPQPMILQHCGCHRAAGTSQSGTAQAQGHLSTSVPQRLAAMQHGDGPGGSGDGDVDFLVVACSSSSSSEDFSSVADPGGPVTLAPARLATPLAAVAPGCIVDAVVVAEHEAEADFVVLALPAPDVVGVWLARLCRCSAPPAKGHRCSILPYLRACMPPKRGGCVADTATTPHRPPTAAQPTILPAGAWLWRYHQAVWLAQRRTHICLQKSCIRASRGITGRAGRCVAGQRHHQRVLQQQGGQAACWGLPCPGASGLSASGSNAGDAAGLVTVGARGVGQSGRCGWHKLTVEMVPHMAKRPTSVARGHGESQTR